MAKFNVGDRIKTRNEIQYTGKTIPVGTQGVVLQIHSIGTKFWDLVHFDADSQNRLASEDDLA